MLLLDRLPRLGGPSGAALRSGLRPSAQTQLPSAPLGGDLENNCDKGTTKLRQQHKPHHIIGDQTANTIVETVGTARRRARVRYADMAQSALYLTRAQFFFDLNAQSNCCCTVFATGKATEARAVRLRHIARETLETQCEPPIAPASWDDFWRTGKNLEGELPHSI